MGEINAGTLYELNKSMVEKNTKELNKGVLNSKKEIIKNFIDKDFNYYYMLLCNERKDYTLFEFTEGKKWTERCMDCANCLVDECLANRGEIRSIDLTKDKDAIEIWLSIEGESYVYYFFPYDEGVISDF